MDESYNHALPPALAGLYEDIVHQVHQHVLQRTKQPADEAETLERDASALLATADHLKTNLYAQAANKLRQRNSLASIHRLPRETLVAIITEDVTTHASYYRRLQTVCQVSYSWWRLILGTPCFWAFLSVEMPEALIDQALSRSLAYPLRIYGNSMYDNSSQVSFTTFLQKMYLHAARWESLSLFPSGNIELDDYLIEPAPRLHSLSIFFPPGQLHFPTACKLFGRSSYLPLREVTLSFGTVNGIWEGLLALEKLELVYIPNRSLPYAQLSRIIRSSPNLHTLILTAIDFVDRIPEAETQPPTYLPVLKMLHVTEMPLEAMKMVLREINAPYCLSVKLTEVWNMEDSGGTTTLLDETMLYLRSAIAAILQQTSLVEISCSSFIFKLSTGWLDSEPLLILLGRSPGAYQTFSWLTGGLGSSAIPCPVLLTLEEGAVEVDPWIQCLTLLPSIEVLVLNTGSSLDSLFDFLGRTATSDGPSTWPLPNLIELRANMESSSFHRLYEMLKNRCEEPKDDEGVDVPDEAAGDQSHAGPESHGARRPAKLTSLALKGRTRVDYDILFDIIELLGDDIVSNAIWEPPTLRPGEEYYPDYHELDDTTLW